MERIFTCPLSCCSPFSCSWCIFKHCFKMYQYLDLNYMAFWQRRLQFSFQISVTYRWPAYLHLLTKGRCWLLMLFLLKINKLSYLLLIQLHLFTAHFWGFWKSTINSTSGLIGEKATIKILSNLFSFAFNQGILHSFTNYRE